MKRHLWIVLVCLSAIAGLPVDAQSETTRTEQRRFNAKIID